MANPSSYISCFLFAFLLLAHPTFCLQKPTNTHNYFKPTSALPANVCNPSSIVDKQGSSSSLELVHKHSPCNKRISNSAYQVFDEMLLQDQLRVNSIHSKVVNQKKQLTTELPVQSGIALGSGDYLIIVALGTPGDDFQLVFDTGSDVTWTQCEPCVWGCYEQEQPKFDATKSSTYKNITCTSSACQTLMDSGNGSPVCSSSTCAYRLFFGEQSISAGFWATETLTIASSDVFDNYMFGCGQQNFDSLGRRTAGYIGFSRSQISFISQTGQKYKNLFSYCIPSSTNSTGFLRLGGEITDTVKFTPFSPAFENTSFYGIDITGISVDGETLPIDDSVYTKAGAIIDSGTVFTRLPPTVYSALSSKIKDAMKDYPATDGNSSFDTCYDFSGYETINVPKISVLLKGEVKVEIDESGIFVPVDGVKKMCLAFIPNDEDDDTAIFGNTQQKTYEIVHDLANGRLGFAPDACSSLPIKNF